MSETEQSEQESFFRQVKTGFALAVGAAALSWGIAVVLMFFGQQTIVAQVELVGKTVSEAKASNDANFKSIGDQISALNATTMNQGFSVATLQNGLGKVEGRLDANTVDDNRQWEQIRANEYAAKAAVTRDAFNEWRQKYERDSGIKTPPVPTQ